MFELCASRTQNRRGNDVKRCLFPCCVCKMNFLFSERTEKISAAAQAALWNLQQSGSNHEEAAQEEQRHYQDRASNGQGAEGGSLWQCTVLSVTPLLPHMHVLLTSHIFTPSNPVICVRSFLLSFLPSCLFYSCISLKCVHLFIIFFFYVSSLFVLISSLFIFSYTHLYLFIHTLCHSL